MNIATIIPFLTKDQLESDLTKNIITDALSQNDEGEAIIKMVKDRAAEIGGEAPDTVGKYIADAKKDNAPKNRDTITLQEIGSLTKEELLSGDLNLLLHNSFYPLYLAEGNDLKRESIWINIENAVLLRAGNLRVKTQAEKNMKKLCQQFREQYKKDIRARAMEEKIAAYGKMGQNPAAMYTNYTCLIGPGGVPRYYQFRCDGYIVDDDGIRTVDERGERLIVQYPIIITKILGNLQTGNKKAVIAFKRKGQWIEETMGMDELLDEKKIRKLSNRGFYISTINAKDIVRYMDCLLKLNDNIIPEYISSQKMGWADMSYNKFIPYDSEILFDGDADFREKSLALTSQKGSRDAWMQEISAQRKLMGNTLLIPMGAALSSILLPVLGINSFVFHIYGASQNGKSVLLMLLASMIGDPEIGRFVGNFKTTITAVEAYSDMLNHLPLLLDDSKNADPRITNSMETLVYTLCNNKGRQRSNVNLGIEKEKTWRNAIITTGEHPLSDKCTGTGARGRLLEMETYGKVFAKDKRGKALTDTDANLEANRIADFVRQNHGWFYSEWVHSIIGLDKDELVQVYKDKVRELFETSGKSTKQVDSLAVILTADKLATDLIFHDGIYIDANDAAALLEDINEIDDNARAHALLCETYNKDRHKFVHEENMLPNESRCDQLGAEAKKEGYVHFYPVALETLLSQHGYSLKTYLKWADKNNKLYRQPSQKGYQNSVMINGKDARVYTICCYDMVKPDNIDDISEFTPIDSSVYAQMEIPFTQ